MHSSQLEEVGFGFSSFVDVENIPNLTDTNEETKQNEKTFDEAKAVLESRKIKEAKSLLRDNAWHFTEKIRSQLWPALCQRHGKEEANDTFYGDTVMLLFGTRELPNRALILPQFVEPSHCHSYHLTREGQVTAQRVLSVLGYACPDITYSPAVYPLTSLFLHYMTEEACYAAMANIMSCRAPVFITQTKLHYEVTWQTCLLLAKRYIKSSIVSLQKQFGGNLSELELLFSDWLWWIFNGIPFPHLVKVADCFLMEGMKVLYRVALALASLFAKLGSNAGAVWEEQFTHGNYSGAMITFCNNLPVTPNKLIKLAFGIRNFSSASMAKMQLKTELLVKSRATAAVTTGPNQMKRARSSENLPNIQSQGEVRMASHTLTIKELLTVWSWLPIRITMYQPMLLYTTEEHGCSLKTFFVRCEKHEPTILIVKTCSGDIFGAYCSARWEERNLKDDKGLRQAYFGTGETFVFSLSPERRKYQWVGLDQGRDSDDETKGDIKHSSELFMAADNHMITIGGGSSSSESSSDLSEAHPEGCALTIASPEANNLQLTGSEVVLHHLSGGSAIWMDENVRYGKTGYCETFDNPPLCPNGDFEIQVLEVYGFMGL